MKNKLIKGIKKIFNNKLYILSFIFSVIIISIIYKTKDVTPFGSKSLLCVDFYHQYGPMLGELYDRMHNFSSFIYSFNMGLGLPFFRNFLNYLSSPFNLIIMLFKRSDLVTSYSYIIGLKAVFASVNMTYYLSKKFNKKDLYLIMFGIIYAFSAYFSAYYWDLMWLDGMVFLPLVALGIENIVNKGTWKFYTIFLAIMLVSNYFIGYMICIFSVVYFLIYNIYKTKLNKSSIKLFFKNCLKFIVASLLAGMLTAALLVPMYYSMKSISATGGTIPKTQYYDFTLEDFLKYHLTGAPTTTFASDKITAPNISCGILAVGLFLLYLLNLDIPIKNKICYILLLSFFMLAFFSPQLDYILHAFHVPNDLPYRYSFIYTFVFVLIAAYSATNIKKMEFPLIIISYAFLMVLLLSISKDNWVGMTTNMIYINMILLTLYFVLYSGYRLINNLKNMFYIALICVSAIDVIVSINLNWNITQVLSIFYQDYNATEELLNYVDDYDNSLFYRIENTSMMTLNDASWYNYHGMTTFSSMAYQSMAVLQNNLGMPGNDINSYYYVQSTPIYDLMFDMKYFIGNSNDLKRYTPIKSIEETANKFNYNVGLIFGTKSQLRGWKHSGNDPFQIENDFMEEATGIDNVLVEEQPSKSIKVLDDGNETIMEYIYDNPNDNLYYYSKNYSIDFMVVGDCVYYRSDNYNDYDIDGMSYKYAQSYSEAKVVNINSSDDKVVIYVAYNSYSSNAFKLYSINQEKFEEAYNYLAKYKFNMSSFKESEITGNITLDDSMMVYTSIPYDEGWHVYVDGNEVETYALGNALLSFNADKGTHYIVIKYQAKGFILGVTLTITAILLMVIDKIFHHAIFNFIRKINKKISKLLKITFKPINKLLMRLLNKIKNIFIEAKKRLLSKKD